MEFILSYWPVLLVGIILGLLAAYFWFRPRQSVRLTDATPIRPHMAVQPRGEGKGLGDEAAAATSDVAGSILQARVHDELPGASGPPDDLIKLKGVGPKLAALLNQRGIIRFEQIAKLAPVQVEAIDESLGAFKGRLTRDQVVEQADYLARGDIDGFEQKFGKL